MGLRCLLGHDFDEPELQREREEDGDEVVTTVREVKTCARCGETQIVSENTEVTTMEQLTDEAAAGAGASGPEPAPGAPEEPATVPDEGGPTGAGAEGVEADAGVGAGDDAGAEDGVVLDEEPGAGSDDAVIIDDGPGGAETEATDEGSVSGDVDAGVGRSDPAPAGDAASSDGRDAADEDAELLGAGAESAPTEAAGATDAAGDEGADAETDDGVILDEDGESGGDRERGAWPSVDGEAAGGDGATSWPDHGSEDEGFSAEVGEGGEADVEFGGGLTPEATEGPDEGAETEYVQAPEDREAVAFDAGGEGGTGITRGESPDLEAASSGEPTEYYCPECGMVRAAGGSSMRAGDICPECKRGYVDERPRSAE